MTQSANLCTGVHRIDLPPGPEAASAAREFVAAWSTGCGQGNVVDVLRLVASELVGNAVRHAGGARSISCVVGDQGVVVEVVDGGAPFALGVEPPADDRDCCGRGLFLVWAMGCGLGSGPVRGGGKWVRAVISGELVLDETQFVQPGPPDRAGR
ncbi:ATP-binding protein [Embleya hyalina]|uniref:ATP-binding protein n=2 Tax=Embleya hyalina TaxID=516124 RepID=A0A401YGD6_9ACTN|nr:ATP-binding protein [Embleya hyalina]